MFFRRRHLALGLAAAAVSACRRKPTETVAEVWDEEPVASQAEALANLAPPWPAPTRGLLDDGLITFWLHEPGAVVLAVRLLLPMRATAGRDAGAMAVVAEALRHDVTRRIGRRAGVALVHGPDRIELSITAPETELAFVISGLQQSLLPRPTSALDSARDRVVAGLAPARPEEIAAALTLRTLLGPTAVHVDRNRTAALARSDLARAWTEFVDPRRAVLLVHSGRPADRGKPELRKLSDQWRSAAGRDRIESATGRLHRPPQPSGPATRLLSAPTTTLGIVTTGGPGPAQLVTGRVIATPTARDRARARLAQRVLQEELNASLAIAGDHAVLLVRSELSGSGGDRDVQRLVERIAEFAQSRHPRQRLFEAAQLWLGARVVEASLTGEDWTALFANAIDLADDDGAVAGALAADAGAMLAIDGEELQAFTKKWIDPRTGEPGWAWNAAGLTTAAAERLGRAVELAPRTLGG